jgi:hypothetical protein
MKTDELPALLDRSKLLASIDKRLAILERNNTLLTQAYQGMTSQLSTLYQIVSGCPPTCPHRADLTLLKAE